MMIITVEGFENHFNNLHYPGMFEESQAGETAKKDVSGRHGEDFNRFIISRRGLNCRKGTKEDHRIYKSRIDTVILDSEDNIIAFAEHKSHYIEAHMLDAKLGAYARYARYARSLGGVPLPLIITATANCNAAEIMINDHENVDVRNNVRFFHWTNENRNDRKWVSGGAARCGYTLNDGNISDYLNYLDSL